MEKEIKYKDLSRGLKAFVVLGWMSILTFLFKVALFVLIFVYYLTV